MLVIEDILGRCAPLLGLAAADLRRRNFYREGQATPYGQPVRHAERLRTTWQQVLDSSDFAARSAADRASSTPATSTPSAVSRSRR